MIYTWKEAVNPGIDAQIAGEELERIRVRHNGRLDKKDVVDASRPESAPLHKAFEWNDAVAAEAHRLSQAGYLIRGITVVLDAKPDASPVRAFVSVMRDEDRSYTSTAHALSDSELRAQVLRTALDELEAWRKRYSDLVEMAKVFAAIDVALAQ